MKNTIFSQKNSVFDIEKSGLVTTCDEYVLLLFPQISFARSFDMISIAHKFHHLFVASLTFIGKELFPMYFFRMLPDIFVLFMAKLAVVTLK